MGKSIGIIANTICNIESDFYLGQTEDKKWVAWKLGNQPFIEKDSKEEILLLFGRR